MSAELSPHAVARRLDELRACYVPETVEQAQARLTRERAIAREPLEVVARRGLAELRALSELARHLHRAPAG